MATGSHRVWGHGLDPTPGEAELAELARLRERFRGHHIFHDVRRDREVRYLAFLRQQLEQAAPPDLGTGLSY
jgi:hypothetical protein